MLNKAERIEELENQLAEASLNTNSLVEEIEGYRKTIASFPVVKAEYDDKVTKLAEAHQKELGDIKILLKATEASVNRRVTEALASIGAQFAPEEVISVASTSPKGLYQRFLSLQGAEQTAFYQQHEKEISAFVHAK